MRRGQRPRDDTTFRSALHGTTFFTPCEALDRSGNRVRCFANRILRLIGLPPSVAAGEININYLSAFSALATPHAAC